MLFSNPPWWGLVVFFTCLTKTDTKDSFKRIRHSSSRANTVSRRLFHNHSAEGNDWFGAGLSLTTFDRYEVWALVRYLQPIKANCKLTIIQGVQGEGWGTRRRGGSRATRSLLVVTLLSSALRIQLHQSLFCGSFVFFGGDNDFSVAAEVLHQEPQVCGGNPTQRDLAVMQLGSSAAVPVSVGACAVRGHVGDRLVRDHSLSLFFFLKENVPNFRVSKLCHSSWECNLFKCSHACFPPPKLWTFWERKVILLL